MDKCKSSSCDSDSLNNSKYCFGCHKDAQESHGHMMEMQDVMRDLYRALIEGGAISPDLMQGAGPSISALLSTDSNERFEDVLAVAV